MAQVAAEARTRATGIFGDMAIQTLIAGLLASALVVGLGAIASAVGSSSECDVKAVSSSTQPAAKAGDCAGAGTGGSRG